MSLANQLICMMELEGMEISEDKLMTLSQELDEAIREERFHIFKDGKKWKGFVTWVEKRYCDRDCVLLNNLVIFKKYKGCVNLWELHPIITGMYPDKPIVWRNRKRKIEFAYVHHRGGKHVGVYS